MYSAYLARLLFPVSEKREYERDTDGWISKTRKETEAKFTGWLITQTFVTRSFYAQLDIEEVEAEAFGLISGNPTLTLEYVINFVWLIDTNFS
jgi:hypothetical protein